MDALYGVINQAERGFETLTEGGFRIVEQQIECPYVSAVLSQLTD